MQALAQANSIATAQERFASASLKHAMGSFRRIPVDYTFRNAFTEAEALKETGDGDPTGMATCDQHFSKTQVRSRELERVHSLSELCDMHVRYWCNAVVAKVVRF